ncbi:MAG: ABC transporter ATP-binding protein [Proteobacteria bacterium]|nr:ABC transporter ATP-binding protein [Pseudomonadota bacterium]
MLTVRTLHAGYGKITVLHGVDLDVKAGEFVAILGANGAGKSTLLKAILGMMPGASGQVSFAGRDLAGLATPRRVRLGIGAIPEGRQLFGEMTVLENLALGLYVRRSFGPPPRAGAMAHVFELLPRLAERKHQTAASLSGGEAQMLAIGRALIARPRLLLCDEPSLGLAPLRVAEMFQTLDRLRRSGVTVVLADQNAKAALRLADRAYVMETGRIVAAGTAGALADDPRLRESYLGG